MAKIVAVIGTLDTKGDEFLFVKKEIEKRGHRALVINVGIVEDPGFEPISVRPACELCRWVFPNNTTTGASTSGRKISP